MNFLSIFIYRPVATSLLTLAIVLAGILAFLHLPVSSLPQVDLPTIVVQANLPGASPETMAATVATPLERALGRIAGLTEMTSSSTLGATRITMQFDLNRDIYGAGRDTQAAINAAASLLPTSLPGRPNYRLFNPADAPILILALTSKSLNRGQLYDVATTILAQKISQIPSIGQVQIGGAALPAVRVDLNPNALTKYGIGLEDVRTAINQANVNQPKGVIENADNRWQIQANDQAKKAADYLPLIVSYRNNSPVRISDLGKVTDSEEDLRNNALNNGAPSVLLILTKQPSANVIETVDQVKALLPELQASIPTDIDLSIAVDRSLAIRASVNEVEQSLLIAVILVFLVVLIFLQDFKTTLIPVVSVPVSLIGACLIMYFCNFSLNTLTLMALTISTGFVIDDAIVVVENTKRHIEQGYPPFRAALLSIKEVGFTVLAMSASLIAVFLPIVLMGGIPGRFFKEFGLTLSAAVLVSLLISLTCTPMLCARLLDTKPANQGRFFQLMGSAIGSLQKNYQHTLSWALQHRRIVLLILLATIGLNIYLYAVIEKGFIPNQDSGRLNGGIQVDQGTSFFELQRKLFQIADLIKQDPAVINVVGFAGSSNNAGIFVTLAPHEQRDSINDVMDRLRDKLGRIPGARLHLFPTSEIRIGGRPSFGSYDFALQSDDLDLLRKWTPQVVTALANLPELNDVNSNQQDKGEQIGLIVNREMALRYGVTQAMIDASLNDAFGQRQVSVIYNPLNQYHVVMGLSSEYWQSPETLRQIYISAPLTPTAGGATVPPKQIPLASFASFAPTNTALSVNHQDQFATTTVSFNLKPDFPLSEAITLIEKTIQDLGVPDSIKTSFQGSAKVFQDSTRNQPWLILAAIICIYIVLGVLYESFIHPLTIISTLPSAGVGALLALMVTNSEFDLIALIGVILLIGIVKKNAIMMIDFALQAEREQGLDAYAAIFQACSMRFRPILMTTLAALFGALPLAIGSGYGVELRQPLGISIIGGLILSQLLTLYTTPVVYLYLDGLRGYFRKRFFDHPAFKADNSV